MILALSIVAILGSVFLAWLWLDMQPGGNHRGEFNYAMYAPITPIMPDPLPAPRPPVITAEELQRVHAKFDEDMRELHAALWRIP